VRRAALPTTALLLGALALAGCSGDGTTASPSSSDSPSASQGTGEQTPATLSGDVPEEKLPTASGSFGEKPELTFPSEEHLAEGAVKVLSEGDGEVVEAGELLVANYLGQVWGGDVFDNSYDRGAPSAFPIGTGYVIKGWDDGLVGQKIGSRVLLSLPPSLGYGENGNPNAGIGGTDTIVFVVDLVASFDGSAGGQADATPGDELPAGGPQVSGELGGPATLTIPEGAEAPSEESVVVLAQGSGETVAEGDSVVVQYAIQSFGEDEGYSTWENGTPEQLTVQAGTPLAGLVGVPVGSRVFLSVPSSDQQTSFVAVMDLVAKL
jgi:FKBP-type peptidyl-prolyl cis-trans isomerases 1